MMRGMILLVFGAAMSGCVWMNPVTALQLATMNPLEADPSVMAVQLHLPEGVDVVEGSAQLQIDAMSANGDALNGQYVLERRGDVWRVPEDVQERMRRDIALARGWESADPRGTSGSFGASFEPCLRGDGPEDGARFTMALQVDPDGAFLPLFDNVLLSNIAEDRDLGRLEPCFGG